MHLLCSLVLHVIMWRTCVPVEMGIRTWIMPFLDYVVPIRAASRLDIRHNTSVIII